ncbi:hypothetical protein B0T22DRAFT_462017 [Podospora appendiculata]|uniref:Uncharacterized protein n=1 Tax=Podospora appendiculata TaxID=314037 RepID=A0AAE1CDM3_9PEZI|nr:hypothetical protein B0T22DRAFT_462017 [Podospora appendiculata]
MRLEFLSVTNTHAPQDGFQWIGINPFRFCCIACIYRCSTRMMPAWFPHLHFVKLVLVATTIFPAPGQAFRWVNNVNFTACYSGIVQHIPQNCSDPSNQICVFNHAGVLTNPDRIFITYQTCQRLCGDGYGLWDPKDILLRISIWMVPAIVLIAHFHFPPLGARNMVCVIAHMLADPIDTLWCLLTRITTRRFLLRKAEDSRLLSAGAVATIWAAYDELNFHDPSTHFLQALKRLQASKGTDHEVGSTAGKVSDGSRLSVQTPGGLPRGYQMFLDDFLILKDGQKPDRSGISRSLETKRTFPERIRHSFSRLRRKPKWSSSGARVVPAYFQQWHRAIAQLDDDERPVLYLFESAAQRLVFNRDESLLTTWISIVGLMSALMGAFVRTWSSRLDNQTAHTIATVTLLLVVVPMVKLSGNLGSFTSSTAAVNIIQQLNLDLEKHFGFDPELFPPLTIPDFPDHEVKPAVQRSPSSYSIVSSNDNDVQLATLTPGLRSDREALMDLEQPQPVRLLTRSELTKADRQLLFWPKVAAYHGMNNSYRPKKSSKLLSRWWSIWLFLVSLVWVLTLCYVPALLISYLTPLKGFACRSLAWTVIASCWLLSVMLDRIWAWFNRRDLKWRWRWIEEPRNLWRLTCWRDMLLAALMTAIVTAQQLGLYNSCYCRSGELSRVSPSYVNLTPFTDEEFIEGWKLWVPIPSVSFLISLICIFILERSFSESGRLLSRSKKDRERMLLHLRRLAVEPERTIRSTRGTSPEHVSRASSVQPAQEEERDTAALLSSKQS